MPAPGPITMSLDVKLRGLERPRVALAVLGELEHQAARWGGPAHDDAHRLRDWLRFIRQATRKAQRALDACRVTVGTSGPIPASGTLALKAGQAMRRGGLEAVLCELRQVAALAVAAMESQDRQGLVTPTRREQAAEDAATRAAALSCGRITFPVHFDPPKATRPARARRATRTARKGGRP